LRFGNDPAVDRDRDRRLCPGPGFNATRSGENPDNGQRPPSTANRHGQRKGGCYYLIRHPLLRHLRGEKSLMSAVCQPRNQPIQGSRWGHMVLQSFQVTVSVAWRRIGPVGTAASRPGRAIRWCSPEPHCCRRPCPARNRLVGLTHRELRTFQACSAKCYHAGEGTGSCYLEGGGVCRETPSSVS